MFGHCTSVPVSHSVQAAHTTAKSIWLCSYFRNKIHILLRIRTLVFAHCSGIYGLICLACFVSVGAKLFHCLETATEIFVQRFVALFFSFATYISSFLATFGMVRKQDQNRQ